MLAGTEKDIEKRDRSSSFKGKENDMENREGSILSNKRPANQSSLSMASEQDTQQRKSLYYAVYTATIALLVYTTYLRIFNCLLGNVLFTAYL